MKDAAIADSSQSYPSKLHELAYGGVGAFIEKYIAAPEIKRTSQMSDQELSEPPENEQNKLREALKDIETVALTISSTTKDKKKKEENEDLTMALMTQFNDQCYQRGLSPYVNMRTGKEGDNANKGKRDLLSNIDEIHAQRDLFRASPEGELLTNAVLALNMDILKARSAIIMDELNPKLAEHSRLSFEEILSDVVQYTEGILLKYAIDGGSKLSTYLTNGLKKYFTQDVWRKLASEWENTPRQFDVDEERLVSDRSSAQQGSVSTEVQSWVERVLDPSNVSVLSPREAIILTMRFGIGGGKIGTLQEVSEVLGITKEGVRQIQEKALEKLLKTPEAQEIVRNHGFTI